MQMLNIELHENKDLPFDLSEPFLDAMAATSTIYW